MGIEAPLAQHFAQQYRTQAQRPMKKSSHPGVA
jgi:hypothetical protein